MQQDPEITWEGTSPYDVLAPSGIMPQSDMKEILKANRYFVKTGTSNKEVVAAWRKLRRIESRLFYDFFLYQMETGEEPDNE